MPQLLEQLPGDADDLVDGLHHVYRNPDGTGLVRDGACNGLPYPPGSIGRELITLGVIKFFNSLNQAQIALLNEVEKQHAPAHIPFGNGNHQAQVGLGQALLCRFALPYQPFEFLFLFRRHGDVLAALAGLLRVGQLLLGQIAGAHSLCQCDFLVGREQVDLSDFLQVHAHRVVDPEGVHQSAGVHDLLVRDLLDLLDGGHILLHQVRKIFLAGCVNPQILHDIVDFIHLFAFQIHFLQGVHQLAGRQFPLLLPTVQQFAQFFGALGSLDHLHQLVLAGL
ncbi:hypothetical protein SDC9_128106 [bioreactor metagenome]|uniref:Uncharacterized protein n=1 Tax=bioreactor metagenome TaxID=1076179 RepID=A0A645CVW2_9ZZZZ